MENKCAACANFREAPDQCTDCKWSPQFKDHFRLKTEFVFTRNHQTPDFLKFPTMIGPTDAKR